MFLLRLECSDRWFRRPKCANGSDQEDDKPNVEQEVRFLLQSEWWVSVGTRNMCSRLPILFAGNRAIVVMNVMAFEGLNSVLRFRVAQLTQCVTRMADWKNNRSAGFSRKSSKTRAYIMESPRSVSESGLACQISWKMQAALLAWPSTFWGIKMILLSSAVHDTSAPFDVHMWVYECLSELCRQFQAPRQAPNNAVCLGRKTVDWMSYGTFVMYVHSCVEFEPFYRHIFVTHHNVNMYT